MKSLKIEPTPSQKPLSSPTQFLLTLILMFFLFVTSAFIAYETGKQKEQKTPPPAASSNTYREPTGPAVTANWNKYTSEKYKFSIKYPAKAKFMPGETIYTPLDFYMYIQGNEYPFGTSVAVGILDNPKKLSLKELGNQTYATDSPEPYDLGWKETNFQGVEALTTKYGPPGDSGLMTIFLFERKDVTYSVWKSPIDEPNSKYFDNLSDQILSTFKFLDN